MGLPNDNQPFVGLGTEYLMPVMQDWVLAGRMGINSRTIGDVAEFNGLSVGVGFVYRKSSLDYGFLPFGSLGNVHRVSLSAKF